MILALSNNEENERLEIFKSILANTPQNMVSQKLRDTDNTSNTIPGHSILNNVQEIFRFLFHPHALRRLSAVLPILSQLCAGR